MRNSIKALAFFQKIFLTALVLFVCGACSSLINDIDDWDVEASPVVECYLEPGQPIRLTLSSSVGFFAPFDTSKTYWEQTNLLGGAVVVVSSKYFTDTLVNQVLVDPITYRVFNYSSSTIISDEVDLEYNLNITLPNGLKIEAYTKMLPVVPIYSMDFTWSPDIQQLARAITYFTDPIDSRDYYQYILRYDRNYDTLPRQNFPFPDDYFDSKNIAMVGTYDLRRNQEAIATLIHINEDHHDFLRSINLATLGSQNPVVLPSKIKSNVYGSAEAIGIFSTLAVDRDTIKIK